MTVKKEERDTRLSQNICNQKKQCTVIPQLNYLELFQWL